MAAEIYKKAYGIKDSDFANKLVNSYMTLSSYLETGITVAASLATMGSASLIGGLTTACVKRFGQTIGTRVAQLVMVAINASTPAALTVAEDATSQRGITNETYAKAFEKFESNLMYGTLGSFVSAPLGNLVSKQLTMSSNGVKKVVETGVETSADVVIDKLITGMSVKESLAQNGVMNYTMMFLGGRVGKMQAKALDKKIKKNLHNLKITKTGDEYAITFNGQQLGRFKSAEEATAFLTLKSYEVAEQALNNALKNGEIARTTDEAVVTAKKKHAEPESEIHTSEAHPQNTNETKAEGAVSEEKVRPVFELDIENLSKASETNPQNVTIGKATYEIKRCIEMPNGGHALITTDSKEIRLDKLNRICYFSDQMSAHQKLKFWYASDTSTKPYQTNIYDTQTEGLISITTARNNQIETFNFNKGSVTTREISGKITTRTITYNEYCSIYLKDLKSAHSTDDISNMNIRIKNFPENIKVQMQKELNEKCIQILNLELNKDITDALIKEKIDSMLSGINKDMDTDALINQANKILEIADLYHTIVGTYEYIGTSAAPTYKRNFREFLGNDIKQHFDDVIQNNNPRSDIDKDYMNEGKIDRLRNYLKANPKSEVGQHLYDKYYLPLMEKTCGLPPAFADMCKTINSKYGVKVFITTDMTQARSFFVYLDQELAEWKAHGDNKAVMPPVLDFSKIKADYIDRTSAYGQSVAGGFSERANNAISLNGYSLIEWAMRHEMTHSNDLRFHNKAQTKQQYYIDVAQSEFKNSKYLNEFLKAGISPRHIGYAYNNTAEFIAVASEGDMSRYSPEFKKMLIDFGMPEWELNMKCLNKNRMKDAEIYERITKDHGEVSYDEYLRLYDYYNTPN